MLLDPSKSGRPMNVGSLLTDAYRLALLALFLRQCSESRLLSSTAEQRDEYLEAAHYAQGAANALFAAAGSLFALMGVADV